VSSIAILGISSVFVVRGIHFGHGPYLGLRGSTSGTTPSPTFRAKKRKAGAESKEPDPQADPQAAGFWNQKLDFIVRDSMRFTLWDFRILLTFNNALPDDSVFKSSGLELVLLVNSGGFPLLLPPPTLAAWKFLGYYSIFFVSSGIALFGSPDCPQTILD
jgi:hypothetical protein